MHFLDLIPMRTLAVLAVVLASIWLIELLFNWVDKRPDVEKNEKHIL
jgi:hypothetical protein